MEIKLNNIKLNDKVKTNQITSRPLKENEIVRYMKLPDGQKIGLNKNGHSNVNIREWDIEANWIVKKIIDKRFGLVHKNNPNGKPNLYLAHHFVKK